LTTQNVEIFTPKRKRIERIAKVANLFAWLVLVYYILLTISDVSTFISEYSMRIDPENEFFSAANYVLRQTYRLFVGIVYWLVLRGVSLGLNMLLEIDLNYQLKTLGEDHE